MGRYVVFVWGCLIILSAGSPKLLIQSQNVIIDSNNNVSKRFNIEGKVFPSELAGAPYNNNWMADTTLSINSGEYKGFLKDDGSFVISCVPPGSYVVEIHNSDYFYEPVRVEINSKGTIRARKVNYVQPSQIMPVPYPLKLMAFTRFKYFEVRQQWRLMDFLFSRMVVIIIFPLLLFILSKLMSDPQIKKQINDIQIPKIGNELPDVGEFLTSLFADKEPKKKKAPNKTNKNKKRK